MPTDAAHEIAATAARLVVEEGLEYAVAKRKAAQALGRRSGRPADLPTNEQVEDEVRNHLALFCAQTQPVELRALRQLAGAWMRRLHPFRPHLGGAVWRGTATRLSCILLDLYCDDIKAPEIALLNQGVDFDAGMLSGRSAEPLSVLSLTAPCPALGERATLHLMVRGRDELRGALKADARGRSWRGDLAALDRLLEQIR